MFEKLQLKRQVYNIIPETISNPYVILRPTKRKASHHLDKLHTLFNKNDFPFKQLYRIYY